MKKTILFDFDGVIADSFQIAYETSKMQHPTLTIESYKDKFKTNITKAVFTEQKSNFEIDFQKEYAKKMKTLKLSPQKKKVLQMLSEKFDFHIISSTNTQTIENFCKVNDIHQHFSDILGQDVEMSKVKKFEMLFNKYNLNPSEIIFITDTVGDIEEARVVNIGTIIAVCDGFQDRDMLEQANPTYIIDSILDLKNVI